MEPKIPQIHMEPNVPQIVHVETTQHPEVFSSLLILLLVIVVTLLICRLLFKLKWSTSICTCILLIFLFLVFGLVPGFAVGRIGFLLILVSCPIFLIVKFFKWAAISNGNAVVNSAERQKILRMIEENKISADEGSELLDAMGKASALRGEQKFSRLDILTLAGIAIVILGFFLPWVYIGRGLHQSGSHIGAIGWVIFSLACLAAVPVFVTPKDLLYKISMLQIFLTLIGSVLVISLLIRAGSQLGAGLPICLAGFILALIASGVKTKKLAA